MKSFIFIGLLTLGTTTSASAETQIPVPSDPGAKYFLLGIKTVTNGALEITTRREGSSGTSYAIRRVTCSPYRFGYIADSDTKAGLSNRNNNPNMSELVGGSISDVISNYACENR